ncbi:hypothetical protein CPB86DRAFT_805099 [Serendipita vermifera]|nr:hypothetical protein CPB86DRAFT_805099 [Serendipita vermifera]
MLFILGIYLCLLLSFNGVPTLLKAKGFELDAHTNRIWQSNRDVIDEIAYNRPCRDGRSPILTNIQSESGLTTYSLQCEDVAFRNASMNGQFEKRQTTTLCSASCNRVCYHPADYNPDPKDCSQITSTLNSRNSRWNVAVGETKVVQWETCIYTFTNQAHNTLNFCDTAWAQIGDGIAWTCGRWLDDPAKGGICTRTEFYVEAVRTPNMPGPSYTLVHSTDTVDNLNTGSTQTTSTSTRTTSSSSSSTISTDSTSTATLSLPSVNLSTVSIETLSNIPTISIPQLNSTGTDLSPNVGDQTDDHSAKKPEPAVIIGSVVGSLAFLALIIAFILLYQRLKRREKAYQMQHGSSAFLPPPMGRNSQSTEPGWSTSSEMYPMEKRRPPLESVNSSVYQIPDTPPQTVTPAAVSREDSATQPRSSSEYTTSNTPDTIAQNSASPIAPPHPRSTQALIAAAAPPDMSQQQIEQLAANFVSLVRGRQTEYEDLDDDVRQPPPYRAD